MDDSRHRENGRHRVDYYKGVPSQWNMPQYQVKDPNAMMMNKKILQIVTERNTAIEERDRALSEKKAALVELDMAIQQRDAAIADRNDAIRERDNSIAALRFQESTMNMYVQRGSKRNQHHATQPSYMRDPHVTEAFPITAVEPVQKSRITKETKARGGTSTARSKKRKKVREDLNQNVTTDSSKAEWDAQELGLMDRISFDETTMPIPIPICSCTGVARQCYKWGSGGWQSSCCTTTLSVYPLPQMPNKRHSRMGGRKMSGSVFTRLISRLASQGHDMSSPVDLKTYWAKHGTNRYITIK